MTNSRMRWINAVAALPAAAGKLFSQKCPRTDYRVLLLGLFAALLTFFTAADARAQSGVTISQLVSMPWQIAVVGNTGCGQTSMRFTGFLSPNTSGKSGILTTASGCGTSSSTQAFTITSLSGNGSGTANLSCGRAAGGISQSK